jgi:hypothetical protein
VGVVVLMNTRLEQLMPGPTANDIAFNLARLTIDYPYEVPSNRVFYGGYIALDIFLLLLIFSILWQIFRWKGWSSSYRSARTTRRVSI